EQDLKDALGGARKSIDKVDPYIDETAEVIDKLDGKVPPADQGTIGRLINDPELGNQISDIAAAGAQATGSFTRNRTTATLTGDGTGGALVAALLGAKLGPGNDLSLPSCARVPRLTIAAAWELFQSAYVSARLDDVLMSGGDLPIAGTPPNGVPTSLDHIHY